MFSNKLIFEPSRRVKRSFYRCDSKFYLDDILEMYDDHVTDGVVYTDGKICGFYELTNQDLKKIDTCSLHLQGQFKAGGQSQNRLRRNREITRDHYLGKVAEQTVEIFYDKKQNRPKVQNLIFCGPAEFKIEASNKKLIRKFFDNQLVHIVNMAYLDYQILIDTVNGFDDPFEKETLELIREMIACANDKLVFGDEIVKSLNACQLETIYVHRDSMSDFKKIKLNYEPTIQEMTSEMINEYGGMIGIKWY